MSKVFLITRPTHESTVSYLYEWGKEVIKFANNKNIRFTDFSGKKANRENVEKYLIKKNPRFVMLNGHGSDSSVCGQNDQSLIESGKNEKLLASKITYAVSCNAAQKLGVKIVETGGDAFIGYAGPFGFIRDASREAVPAKDKLAEPFKITSNSIPMSILKGKTAGDACEFFKKKTFKMIRKHSISEVEPGYKDICFWLFWNMRFQRCLGNSNAKF